MTSKFPVLLAAFLCCNILSKAQTDTQQTQNSNVHIGLVYPLSTNGFRAATYTNLFSAHALIGVSKNERAFCAAGFGNIVKDSAKGLVAAGFFNVIGHGASGMQAAGFINCIGGKATGMQAAGFTNITDSATGAQFAGFVNVNRHNIDGFQAAGFINTAKKVNTQIAGFVNVADSVSGSQVAGFINVAGKVKGVQIAGFINVADSSDYPIGLINIIKKGQKAIGITIDETGTTLAAFRSGGKVLYGIVGAGFNFNYNSNLFAMQAGLGAHLPLSKYITLSGELSVTSLTDFWWGSYMNSAIRIMPSIKIRKVEAFAGPSINYANTTHGVGTGIINNTLWHEQIFPRTHDLHIGFLAGVQYHL